MEKCRFGFIYGIFDMFNTKDLNSIEEAKTKCDTLIVGVYSDELAYSVDKKQPVITCENRKKIIGAIKDVDHVIEISNKEQVTTKRNELEILTRESISKDIYHKNEEQIPKKYKKGFIQGTFDMFHIGHLNLINKAKTQCDELIVGVNTDDLVRMYKNKTPIVPYEDRKKIVGAIKGVDEVIGMSDRNKIKAARDIGFNALIMGSDWQGTEFYNIMEEELKQIGVDIVYLPYTQGISSTLLRKQIGKDKNGCIK